MNLFVFLLEVYLILRGDLAVEWFLETIPDYCFYSWNKAQKIPIAIKNKTDNTP
jgi:hypothetical protein